MFFEITSSFETQILKLLALIKFDKPRIENEAYADKIYAPFAKLCLQKLLLQPRHPSL